MTAGLRSWVILVMADPKNRSSAAAAEAGEGPTAMFRHALSLTSLDRICCVAAAAFLQRWASVYDTVAQSNRLSLVHDEPVLEGLRRALVSISERDPNAEVTVLPYNHCAVEPASWLDSVKGALRLAAGNRNNVYLLHDDPENDPRIALKKPEVCTSSVMIGSSRALQALCTGERATSVVELIADSAPSETSDISSRSTAIADLPGEAPINVVHVRDMEEYARLQRTGVHHRPWRKVDLQA